MKRLKLTALTLSALALVILTGCEKEPFDYKNNCKCGIIVNIKNSGNDYILYIENNCSGNVETKRVRVAEFTEWNYGIGQGECLNTAW